ncbi:hypothetical protein GPROT1_02515 [Gammaproteobacteria bacterium]|nr:hypothetical protein GPROT1_02515 [Gammaproteobacteria bacterium]
MTLRLALVASLAAAAFAAGSAYALNQNIPKAGLPSASEFSGQVLIERPDVVSWKTLAQVETVKQGSRMVPQFAKPILALDRKDARVQGFMIPLDMGDRQKHFLVSAVPPHCSFCLPAGPEAVVEVFAKEPVGYTLDPIVVSGRFAVQKDDPNGVLYRLHDAAQVEVAKVSPGAPPGFVNRQAPLN